MQKKYFLPPASLASIVSGCHAMPEISFLVRVANGVCSLIPGTMNNRERCFNPSSWSMVLNMTMESSSLIHGRKSTPTSSVTSRAAQSASGSSLLILPLGKPHPEFALYPFTISTLSSLGLRMMTPPVGTLNL